MKMLGMAFRYLWARPLTAALNLILLSLGLASVTFVLLVSQQMDKAFDRDLAGIDLVVGAKGSPLQLILAGVFHIDVPPGNIPLSEVQALAANSQVAQLIPLSLGDSFRGFRIVGTTPDYIKHYDAKFAQGVVWAMPMQAVVGAQVAASSGLKVGDSFAGTHGLGEGGEVHEHSPYRVTGVLSPCGCVLDRLALTATESVWEIHAHHHGAGAAHAEDDHDDHDHDDHDDHDKNDPAKGTDREVTLALIQYKSPLSAASFPRFINKSTQMQAAAPAMEITRLLSMVGVGTEVLRGFGAVLLLTAGLSVFIALWNAVRERRADLAMLRMLGGSPQKITGLVLCEALWLALLATAIGLLVGHALTALVSHWLAEQKSIPIQGWVWLQDEWWVLVAALGVGLLAALIPAISAYRVDVARLLNTR